MTTATSITVRVPLNIRRRPGKKTVVTPVAREGTVPTCADPALVKALARGFRYQRLLDEGRYASISEMAAVEKLDRGYMGRLLQLTLLSPEMVKRILEDRLPASLGLTIVMEPFPLAWSEQDSFIFARSVER